LTRAGTLALAATAVVLVALAYQRPHVCRVRLGGEEEAPSTDGFGPSGVTGALQWSLAGPSSRIVFRDAGQLVPGAHLRLRLGIPPETPGPSRRVALRMNGVLVAEPVVGRDFHLRRFDLAGAPIGRGDAILGIAGRGVGVVRAELVTPAPPVVPPWRTLFLVVVLVTSLPTVLGSSRRRAVGRRLAAAVTLAAGVLASAGLAWARGTAVPLIPLLAWPLAAAALLESARARGLIRRVRERLLSPGWGATLGTLAPVVVLGSLGAAGLGASPAAVLPSLLVGAFLLLLRLPSDGVEALFGGRGLRKEWAFVAAVTAVGFAFRLVHLGEIPFSIFRDEARHGLLALRLLAEPSYRPLFVGPPINQPLPYFVVVAKSFDLFGPGLFSLRLVSALAGALTVPLLWLLVRELLGPREGVVAALFLAVSSWHVSISRFAVNYVEPSLFSLPAYLILWRALPGGSALGVAAAAALVGLAQYTAHTAKSCVLAAAFLVLAEAFSRLRAGDGAGLRRVLAAAAAGVGAGLVVLAPLGAFVVRHPDAYFARAGQVSLWAHAGGEKPLRELVVENVTAYAGAFHLEGDANGRHHLPRAPLLDPVTGLSFLVGLGVAAAGRRRPAARFLLVWLTLGLLPGLLTVDAPSALRTVVAAPAVCALAALGLSALPRLRSGPGFRRAVTALLLATAVCWNAWTYFVRMYRSPTVWRRFAPIATHLGERLHALRETSALPDRTALLVPRPFLEEPDTRHVLRFYWPEGLELVPFDDGERVEAGPAAAAVLPNVRDFWALVAEAEPRYAGDAEDAVFQQRSWTRALAPFLEGETIVGPPFPATDRPSFWLYLRRPLPR
jgi:4-amino-4-deoxy-L-arabinose transferase-like glycosyltransferase